MSLDSTESKATSQDKRILQDISIQDFLGICHEYKVVQHSVKNLLKIADNNKTNLKERVNIYEWLVEMNVGKPKERPEFTLIKESSSAGIFLDFSD